MPLELSDNEIRVLGCLMEKQVTTPDQYPLSLNALTNACNQKSSRDPVLSLAEDEVQQALDELRRKHLVMERSGFGSRVPKYEHRFCNTEFGGLRLTPQEFAVLCLLFLRGAQTPGELRSRSARLCSFEDVREVESVLGHLATHEEGPFVTELAREPGRREARFAQLCGTEPPVARSLAAHPHEVVAEPGGGDRVDALERAVEELRLEVLALKRRLADPQP